MSRDKVFVISIHVCDVMCSWVTDVKIKSACVNYR